MEVYGTMHRHTGAGTTGISDFFARWPLVARQTVGHPWALSRWRNSSSAIWKTTSVLQDPPRPRLGSRIAERFASLGWSAELPELRGRTFEPPRFDQ